ncbi:hypothetical protein NSS78_08535 [Bacillus sp. FSL W8-0920]|uniref:hypothetical protein n=1 Tax=Bacillus sp. FSL W8-0920 TaxID=2954636 RepID=UPI003158DAF8
MKSNDFMQLFGTGQPVRTPIGDCHFIKIKEYVDFSSDLQLMADNQDKIVESMRQALKDKLDAEDIEEMVSGRNLFQLILMHPLYLEAYQSIFIKVFDDKEIMSKISNENFLELRSLVLKMHLINEDKKSPNSEIEELNQISKELKSSDNGADLSDMISVVVVMTGVDYSTINEWSLYQLYLTYHRILKKENHDASVIFATVSSEVKVNGWDDHIDLYAEEKHHLSQKDSESIEKLLG